MSVGAQPATAIAVIRTRIEADATIPSHQAFRVGRRRARIVKPPPPSGQTGCPGPRASASLSRARNRHGIAEDPNGRLHSYAPLTRGDPPRVRPAAPRPGAPPDR